jgi:hypothetical protein
MTQKDAYAVACSMEDPLRRIRTFTAALARLAPTIDDGCAASINPGMRACDRGVT